MEDEAKGHLAVVHRLAKNIFYITGNFLLDIQPQVIFLYKHHIMSQQQNNSHPFLLGCDESDSKIFQLEIGTSAALLTHNEPKTKTCTFAIRDNQILLEKIIQEAN